MEAILNQCKTLYDHLNCCHQDGRVCDCSQCLSCGFYGGEDTYACIKKLSYYVMRYGTVYTNEIYYFLLATGLLENNFKNDLKVLSLGCGFGPDYIALSKYIKDKNVDLELKYWGYDKEIRWQKITKGIIDNLPHEKDLLKGFSLENYDLIFLNKIFSTLKSADQHEKFLELLVDSINKSMQRGAFIVFNDVNNSSMGRDRFHSAMNGITEVIGKFYYDVQGAYTGDYTAMPYSASICSTPFDLPVSPYRTVNKTVFFVYRKI